ncbi:hypothetical protein R70006_06309 [Paraburkholderia domus]|uniref:hypothetical protein n=1 Tax=Paraburkholderia domus TaxID=2793075 RepID=UPI0019149B1E|nr:hypothetical protein [Paraburkholderia domus]MBK5052936.1 hypothetical protein [Burkholderia sp. R-70006]CAE6823263.1 hypothetical protein R70006_06309 [Paraburkholderia domus]
MSHRLADLGIERATSDADRAILLAAICRFARSVGDAELEAEADALMPEASPFEPPETWLDRYTASFESYADEDRGTYSEDVGRYAVEYWQALSDAERAARLQQPAMGCADGQRDAEGLNSVDTTVHE